MQDKSRAPKAPARKVWLPLMIEVYHLQKRHPDAGKLRIWSLLAHPDISVRTVARSLTGSTGRQRCNGPMTQISTATWINPTSSHPLAA